MMKQKFLHLSYIKLRRIPEIVNFIRACCVLHNLALDDSFLFEEFESSLSQGTLDTCDEQIKHSRNGLEIRERICKNLF